MKERHTQKQVIEKIKAIHGDSKYLFDKTVYKNTNACITVICPIHGDFQTTAKGMLRGHGCRKCGKTEKLTTQIFIERAHIVHNNLYNYSKAVYKGIMRPITITCLKHGDFTTVANNHLHGRHHGCPNCNLSKGEIAIKIYLDLNNIEYEQQKKFENCIGEKRSSLRFDFFLPEQNLCIEYQGQQHFVPVKHLGGQESFERYQLYDKLKQDFCRENGISLLCIPYWDRSKIANLLKKYL